MIKPLSNNGMGIEPIKVPHNNVSFSGLGKISEKFASDEFVGKITKKAKPILAKLKDVFGKVTAKATEYVKKAPELLKKAGGFIADKFNAAKKFLTTKLGDLKDVTKNPGRKARTTAIATAAGLGAAGITTTAVIGKNKKD